MKTLKRLLTDRDFLSILVAGFLLAAALAMIVSRLG